MPVKRRQICLETFPKQLNILDCTLINKAEGHYETKVFRKDAITNVLIKPLSCHDGTIIYGVFKGFLHRARKICSEQYLKEEIEFITAIFVENGYERNKLEAIINNSGNHRDGISETFHFHLFQVSTSS